MKDINNRILIIDDQETIHEDYRKIMSPRRRKSKALDQTAARIFGDRVAADEDGLDSFEIDSAFQGHEGLQLVQQAVQEGRPYSLAFVDLRMPPGWDGVETAARIWEVDPEILVVLCSAYSDYSWEEMVKQLGRTDRFLILKKPFDNIEVRQLAHALSEKWRLARTDLFTGLLNRRSFLDHVEREWKRATRHGRPMSCVMVDIDFFKKINDSYGHAEGDLALKGVANTIKQHCRGSDYACRYGGEEFCILLPDTNEAGASAWSERVRRAIAESPLPIGNQRVMLTASFGVAERLDDTPKLEIVLDRADQAMMVAKQSGRNRVVRFTAIGPSIGSDLHALVPGAELFQGVLARHVMTAPVACLNLDCTAGAAADFFLQARINSAPVVDQSGQLIGILSEKDLMGIMLKPDAWRKPISEIVQANVVSYSEDTPIQSIFDFLCRVTIRRVVVVCDGRPTGVISRGSLLRWFTTWAVAQSGQSSAEAPPLDREPTHGAKSRLVETAKSLARQAQQLVRDLDGEQDDLVPPVVVGVSKMQELIYDVLAYSRYVNLKSSQPQQVVYQ